MAPQPPRPDPGDRTDLLLEGLRNLTDLVERKTSADSLRYDEVKRELRAIDTLLRGDGGQTEGLVTRVSRLESTDEQHDREITSLREHQAKLLWAGLAGLGGVVLALVTAVGTLLTMLMGGGSHK